MCSGVELGMCWPEADGRGVLKYFSDGTVDDPGGSGLGITPKLTHRKESLRASRGRLSRVSSASSAPMRRSIRNPGDARAIRRSDDCICPVFARGILLITHRFRR